VARVVPLPAARDDATIRRRRRARLLLIDTMGWPACRCIPTRQCRRPEPDVTAQFHWLAPGSDWLLVGAVAPVAPMASSADRRVWSVDGQLWHPGWPAALAARSSELTRGSTPRAQQAKRAGNEGPGGLPDGSEGRAPARVQPMRA
jgi:hypothetical protein